jgi:glutamate dehydrogenase (NAD(P)+)
LQCKLILEGASLPLTARAEDYLIQKGVVVLPDLVVNSGSTIAGYFEYAKNIGRINPGTLTRRWD